jgi:hypothetical protein
MALQVIASEQVRQLHKHFGPSSNRSLCGISFAIALAILCKSPNFQSHSLAELETGMRHWKLPCLFGPSRAAHEVMQGVQLPSPLLRILITHGSLAYVTPS